MDPLSATSLAACVVNFLDFASKLISITNELRGSGTEGRVGTVELEQITSDLLSWSNRLKISRKESLRAEADFEDGEKSYTDHATKCQSLAKELLGVISKVKNKGGRSSTWNNLRTALLSIWHEKEIEALETRLDRYRQQIMFDNVEVLRRGIQKQNYTKRKKDRLKNMTPTEKSADSLKTLMAQNHAWKLDIMRLMQKTTRTFQSECVEDISKTRLKSLTDIFLKNLAFEEIEDREVRIHAACERTFEWIYSDPSPTGKAWSNFSRWLSQGDSIYWITGKPGSGKSTLMKFLFQDGRTAELLRKRPEKKMIITGFFFWNSGAEIQMSQEGLFRALLRNIFKAAPELIIELCPGRFEIVSHFEHDPQEWTLSECQALLKQLLVTTLSDRYEFFFFLDGLDEFLGDPQQLIDLIKEFAASSNVRMCVASRPWIVFQDAFDTTPSLMLQYLTQKDIEIYISNRFNNHKGFQELEQRSAQVVNTLRTEITQKSSGVFLWVRLVVASLLRGISNGDRVSDLQRRLTEIPEDLDTLFRSLLFSVEPFYREHMCQLFRICRAAGRITIFNLALADEEITQPWEEVKQQPWSQEEINFKVRTMSRRLESRSKGLLEVSGLTSTKNMISGPVLQTFEDISYHKISTVQYLHRTVRDFIMREDIWRDIILSSGATFDPYASLCQANALEISGLDLVSTIPKDVDNLVSQTFSYASRADELSRMILTSILNAISRYIRTYGESLCSSNLASHFYMSFPQCPPGHSPLIPFAFRFDLHWWLKELLTTGHPSKVPSSFKPYLLQASEGPVRRVGDVSLPGTSACPRQCIRVLLESGAGRDDSFDGKSIVPLLTPDSFEEIMDFNRSHANGSNKSLRLKVPRHISSSVSQVKRKVEIESDDSCGNDRGKRHKW